LDEAAGVLRRMRAGHIFIKYEPLHPEERHFALVEAFAFASGLLVLLLLTNQGPLVISCRSGTQSDPRISSVTRSIMIINSNSKVHC
jgi:hypothetical protein